MPGDREIREVLAERRLLRSQPPGEQSLTHDMESSDPACGCLPLDGLFERITGVPDVARQAVLKRRVWLQWLKRLRGATQSAEDWGWTQSSMGQTKGSKKLQSVLVQFCTGRVPMPEAKRESSGRFDALFELVIPNNRTTGTPAGLAYTAHPVGSLRGTGVSPSASGDIDQGRYQNYVDGPTIKSRKRRSTSKTVGGGSVVQRVMQKG